LHVGKNYETRIKMLGKILFLQPIPVLFVAIGNTIDAGTEGSENKKSN
jgi:hypothetical protein